MLYENSDPLLLTEPGGVLDVADGDYRAAGQPYHARHRLPLDADALHDEARRRRRRPFQTLMIVGIEDPEVLANLQTFHDRLLAALDQRVRQTFGATAGDFDLSLRLYGWNGVSGRPPRRRCDAAARGRASFWW